MPASMMSAETGGTLKVTGSSIAMVATGPMPGSTPIKVPSRQPIRQNSRLSGVIATPKPITRLLKISMVRASGANEGQGLEQRPQRIVEPIRQDGHRQSEELVEDDRRADRHAEREDDGLTPEHLAAANRRENHERDRGDDQALAVDQEREQQD